MVEIFNFSRKKKLGKEVSKSSISKLINIYFTF